MSDPRRNDHGGNNSGSSSHHNLDAASSTTSSHNRRDIFAFFDDQNHQQDPSETPSIYSMDSFVADFTDHGEDGEDDAEEEEEDRRAPHLAGRQPSYISPASSVSIVSESSEMPGAAAAARGGGDGVSGGGRATILRRVDSDDNEEEGSSRQGSPPPPPPPLPPSLSLPPPPASSGSKAPTDPSASSATSEHGSGSNSNQNPPLKPRHRKMSSDNPVIKPAHPFFASGYFDQDENNLSDGSLVFLDIAASQQQSQQQQLTPQKQQQQSRFGQPASSAAASATRQHNVPPGGGGSSSKHPSRDQVSSLDSAGSSGSLHYVGPKLPPAQQQAQQPPAPQLLPYHVRRKLMQQRQQQRQQQQQQLQQPQQHLEQQSAFPVDPSQLRQHMPTGNPQGPPLPYPGDFGGLLYPGPRPPPLGALGVVGPQPYLSLQQQSQQQSPGYPYPYGMTQPPYPLHPHPHPQTQPSPSTQKARQWPNYGASSNFPEHSVPFHPGQPPSSMYRSSRADAMTMGNRPPLRGQGQQPMQAPQQPAQALAGTQSQRSMYQVPHRPQFPHRPTSMSSSSFDSSGGDDLRGGSSGPKKKDSSPPPPPPPPPFPATLVRGDSAGSVSSLGSLDRSSTGLEHTRRDLQDGSRNSGAGLFQRLNPWAVAAAPPSTGSQVHNEGQVASRSGRDYHRTHLLSRLGPAPAPGSDSGVRGYARAPPPHTNPQGHRRLSSIDNDEWSEGGEEEEELERSSEARRRSRQRRLRTKELPGRSQQQRSHDRPRRVQSSSSSEGEGESERNTTDESDPDERSKLLPPSGISSNELDGYGSKGRHQVPLTAHRAAHYGRSLASENTHLAETLRLDNSIAGRQLYVQDRAYESRKQKRKKNSKARGSSSRGSRRPETSQATSSAPSNYDYWLDQRAIALERERAKFIRQWKYEVRAEEEAARLEEAKSRWHRRFCRFIAVESRELVDSLTKAFLWTQEFFANLPLTIGAIALATANLGVDWFKFTEENLSACQPVHFHSSQCTFPEFPGCFYCDSTPTMYNVALKFHWTCSAIAGLLAFMFLVKLFVARKIAFDELSTPTTAAPAGLICMTMDIVFAGRGLPGMCVVLASSFIHLCLAVWFIYITLVHHMMPDPSWFPNTVGIGMSAVKTWLYFPAAGHVLMAVSLCLNIFFFPISLIRVAMNPKISAPVGWMQMSAPNISLYALTIMAQPSFSEEHPDVTHFQKVHRMVYLPCMHFLFALCLIGMIASVSSLAVRWQSFRKIPFCPAHAAFCCPTLSHANAIQAYRAAVNSFSQLPENHPFPSVLYGYWVFVLGSGTLLTLFIATRFISSLPKWTHINLEGEVEPPAPCEMSITLSNAIATGDAMIQPFVSPAVLQANETGALYLSQSATGQPVYVRTRKVTALGFEPIMDELALDRECELLLEHVSLLPPHRRNRTLSVPGADFRYGAGGSTDARQSTVAFGSPESLPLAPRSQSYRLPKETTRRYSGSNRR